MAICKKYLVLGYFSRFSPTSSHSIMLDSTVHLLAEPPLMHLYKRLLSLFAIHDFRHPVRVTTHRTHMGIPRE